MIAMIAGRLLKAHLSKRADLKLKRVSLPRRATAPCYTHENAESIALVVEAARRLCGPNEKVIWRAPFRWMDDAGVRPNHFEGMDLSQLKANFGITVVHDFHHVAVIRERGK